MGFLDFAGEMLGNAMAQCKEAYALKSEYEHMSDIQLKREKIKLKGESGADARYRHMAVSSVLKDRGYE